MWPLALLVGVLVLGALVMPVEVKAGVELEGLNLEHMAPVVAAVEKVWSGYRVPAVITSALRDSDSDEGGAHPRGDALDFRVKNIERKFWEQAARAVAAQLNPVLYDVVLEIDNATPTADAANRSHLHVEWDPRPSKISRTSGFSIMNI